MRDAIYARYSTDLQNEVSIKDQHRLCLHLIASHGWSEAETYADRGTSGASHLRPAYQPLLRDARDNRLNVVVAEGLDRQSRDQEHIAAFFKQMRLQRIPIVTVRTRCCGRCSARLPSRLTKMPRTGCGWRSAARPHGVI